MMTPKRGKEKEWTEEEEEDKDEKEKGKGNYKKSNRVGIFAVVMKKH